ncbi:MAG: glycine zipper 2TM domain-containing protein [Epsilonproteobacteria bacterium]|nr:glycine zipper 2TM domain-containing protein [Campylobacterota bacterium]
MKKILIASSTTIILILSGCATNSGPEYDGNSYQQIKTYEIGTVQSVRPVVISDNGTGTFIGAIVGTVLGSMVGQGRGSTLATLAGGLGGAYAGSQAAKANASELSVRLDDGRNIVVVVKGKHFLVGDRVKIIKDGNRADQVYKIN